MTPEQRDAIEHALYHAQGDFMEWSQNHSTSAAEDARCRAEQDALFAQVRAAFGDDTLDARDQKSSHG